MLNEPTSRVLSTQSTLLQGHCLDVIRTLPGGSIDCCVTSPPYWGLRDYHTDGLEWDVRPGCRHVWTPTRHALTGSFCWRCGAWHGSLGLEPTPDLYVRHLVTIFQEVRRVLRDQGTLWIVLGDSYAGSWGSYRRPAAGAPQLKRKDLIGIPWMVAFALRKDGWYLRSNVVWHKPNAMPESVRDRPTFSHEFLFLLAKSPKYHYDADAIREPIKPESIERWRSGKTPNRTPDQGHPLGRKHNLRADQLLHPLGRNRRSVWRIPTSPYRGAHFATFPKELVRPCIRAGAPSGGIVLDPFAGTGTVGLVCKEDGRRFIGVELNREYIDMANARMAT